MIAGWLLAGLINSVCADQKQIAFFETHVRPVFAEHCYSCHSAGAEKLKAGLYLDSRAGIEQGGESGPLLVAGDPEKSLLIRAVGYREESLEMPPRKKLPAAVIEKLTEWVRMGAPMPGEELAALAIKTPVFDWEKFRREHWRSEE
ncbi:MAG: c-type cytochrome domain-containing protein, partial [Verrucomicrobiota bacterium]